MRQMMLAAACLGLAATAAIAAEPDIPEGSPFVRDVTACQSVSDSMQRLACFDATVAKLGDAAARRDVVVLDKEEVRKTRRSLFGFSLPDIPFFGGGRDGDEESDRREQEEVRQLESTIVKVGSIGSGKWIMVLPDGAAWQYAEVNRGIEPAAGDKILIKRGPLGGYMANIDGATAVRVQRVR